MIPNIKKADRFIVKARLVETAAGPEKDAYNTQLRNLRERAIKDEMEVLRRQAGKGATEADIRRLAESIVDQRSFTGERGISEEDLRGQQSDLPLEDSDIRDMGTPPGSETPSEPESSDEETPAPPPGSIYDRDLDDETDNIEETTDLPVPPEVKETELPPSPGTRAQQQTDQQYDRDLDDYLNTIVETKPEQSAPSSAPPPRSRAEILDQNLNNDSLFNYVGRFIRTHGISGALLNYLNEVANDLPKIKSNPFSEFIFSLFDNPMDIKNVEGLADARFKRTKIFYRYIGMNRSLIPSKSSSGGDVTPSSALELNGMVTVPRSILLRVMEEVKARGYSTAMTERMYLPVYIQNYVGRSGKGIIKDGSLVVPKGVERINPGPDGRRYADAVPVGYLHYTNNGVWLMILDTEAYKAMRFKATAVMLKNRRLVVDPNNPNINTGDPEVLKRELKRRASTFFVTPFTKFTGFVNASRSDYVKTKNALIGDLLLSYLPFAGGQKQFYRQKVAE